MIGYMTHHDVVLAVGVGNRILQVSFGSSTKRTTFLTTKLPSGVETSHCDDLQSLADSNLAQHRFVTAHVPGQKLEPIANRSKLPRLCWADCLPYQSPYRLTSLSLG